jgi:hypothetical protein
MKYVKMYSEELNIFGAVNSFQISIVPPRLELHGRLPNTGSSGLVSEP